MAEHCSKGFHKLARVASVLLILLLIALMKHNNYNNGIVICMASSRSSAELQIPETELNALLSFREGITNDPTLVLQNWTSKNKSSACSWQGVQCVMSQSNHSINVIGLNLTNLRLEGTISPALGQLTFLQILNLSINSLHGIIPLSITVNCTTLQHLDVSHNHITGSIPDYNTYLPSLETLNLANNQLTGSMPSSINSTSIVVIDLAYNNISGALPVLYNSPSLQDLILGKNSLTGTLPPSIVNITSLHYFVILGNSLTGTIPLGFSHLATLGLAENHFHGVIPADLFNSSTLQMIDLAANNLTGTIPSVPVNQVNVSSLFILSLSENGLSGEVPESLYNFTNLQELEIERNKLSGTISHRLADLKKLKILQYGFNTLHGGIPEFIGNLSQLTRVDFQVNNLEGKIPESIGKLTVLQGLYMDHNNFHGGIPLSLSNCNNLVELDLSRNIHLGGNLNSGFFNKLTRLSKLDLSFCNLTGPIPADITQSASLNYLILAGNSLSGPLTPALFQEQAAIHLIYIDLSQNLLEGYIPSTVAMLTSLKYLDFSQNKLVGNIPSEISSSLDLIILNLSQNFLVGSIPLDMTTLRSLTSFNLSWNQLEGAVPLNFSASTKVYLEGNRALCFPNTTGNKLQNISGIADVCVTTVVSRLERHNHIALHHVILTSILCFLALIIIIYTLYTRCYKSSRFSKMQKNNSRSTNKQRADLQRLKSQLDTAAGGYQLRLSHEQLRASTCDFHPRNKIGEGSYGSVYKGQITNADGMSKRIAVKVLRATAPSSLQECAYTDDSEEKQSISVRSTSTEMRSFVTELMTLSKLRHRNIVRILGYCSNLDINAIILEYMPNLSLENYLHPGAEDRSCSPSLSTSVMPRNRRWDWKTRLRIATGVAEALVYLHSDHDGHERIIHGDLKPSNILLDQYMEARVADFSISRTLRKVSATNNSTNAGGGEQMLYASVSSFRGTIGYCAPECASSTQISTKVDVYSYGIVLLEILTRRQPTSDIFGDDIMSTLVEILSCLIGSSKKGFSKVMDHPIMEFILQDQIPMSNVMSLLKVIIICLHKDPLKRPNMREILSKLKDVISQDTNTTPTNITC